jgi:hypothetical protein
MYPETNSPEPRNTRSRLLVWLILAVAIAGSIVVRLIVNTKFQAPTILTDELTYSQLARDIADGKFSFSTGYGIVYPLLLAPSWAFNTYGTDAFTWMKATNAVLVSLTAIPVFFWARRMMRPGFALLAAVLTLLMPSMAYSGTIMTENAFLLFFMLAAWAIAVAVERPTIINQILVIVAIVVAFETRVQAVVLLAALPVIILLHVLAEERSTGAFSFKGYGRRLVRFWPLAAIAALGVLAVIVRTVATDWHPSQLLQAYSATTGGQYAAPTISRYFLWHLGEATFALGVIPVAALFLLVGMGILNRTRSSAERAYLCTAIVALPLVVLQVAIFTSFWSQRVSERNMYCVFPIALIALALWFDIKLPRPRRTAALAAAAAGVLTLSVPFVFLYQRVPSTETWAVVLPEMLTRKFSGGADDVQILIVTGVGVALLMFGILRARSAVPLIALAIACFFLAGQAAAVHVVAKAAADYRNAPSLGADASWIDAAVPKNTEVAFIFGSVLGPDTDRIIGWETGFFNRHPIIWKTWGADLTSNPLTGAVITPDGSAPVLPPFVITPSTHQFVGPVVTNRAAYVLQKPTKPYALALNAGGVYPDGWTGVTATYDILSSRTNCTTATLTLTRPAVAGPTQVTISTGKLQQAPDGSVVLAPDATTSANDVVPDKALSLTIDVPAPPARIQVTTATPFAPSATGSLDTRQLGIQAGFTCGPLALG